MSRPSRSPALTALSLMASLIVPALAPNGRVAGPAVGAAAQDPAPPAKRAPDVAGLRELVELELYGEVLAAESSLRTLPPDAPDREQALALLARAVFETRGPEAALALLDEAELETSSSTAGTAPGPVVPVEPVEPGGPGGTVKPGGPLRLERARTLIELDELEGALAALGAVDGQLPAALAERAPPEAWLYLGRAHARRGDLARARAPLQRFVQLAPRHPEAPSALYVLAQEAVRRGDGVEARALSARGRELGQWLSYLRVRRLQVRESPDEPLPLLGLALVWMGADELEPAAAVLDRLLERFPDHAPGWFHRGEIRRLSGDLKGARGDYDRAVALDPEQTLARFNRAILARMEGRDADARGDFERLVQGASGDDPRMRNAHLELARLLKRAGEDEAAGLRYAQYVSRGGREPLE